MGGTVSVREDILGDALKCVSGDRNLDYGAPEQNFQAIAELWNAYLGDVLSSPLQPRDVAIMMVLFKIARLKKSTKQDNWIDIAGYAACGGEIDYVEGQGSTN